MERPLCSSRLKVESQFTCMCVCVSFHEAVTEVEIIYHMFILFYLVLHLSASQGMSAYVKFAFCRLGTHQQVTNQLI